MTDHSIVDDFFDMSLDMLCIASLDGCFVKLNHAWTDAMGWPEGDLMAKPPINFIHPADRAGATEAWDKIAAGAPVVTFDARFRRRSGEYSRLRWTSRANLARGLIYSVARDITEAEETRIKLEKFTARLNESERFLGSLFEESPVGFNLCRMDGLWVESNPAFLNIIGYSAEEADGGLTYWQLTPRKYDETEKEQLQHLTETGRYGPYEKEFIRKDGSLVPVRLNGFLFERDGEQYIWSMIEDISDTRRAQMLKDEFVSTVSHELRTPLTSINGSLKLLAGGVGGIFDDIGRNMIDVALRNSDRLVNLINDILDVQKIAMGKMRFDFRTLDIGELVKSAVEANESFGREHGVTYRIVSEGQALFVEGDESRLTQVMNNLLSNAAKFSDRGSEVVVEVAKLNNQVRVSVKDRGVGIPEEFRGKIFEKFMQADGAANRKVGGTGLGLNISRALVEKHGGIIDYSSVPEEGATFYFILPLAHAEIPAPESA